MKIEQLNALDKRFKQLKELQRVYKYLENGNSVLYFSCSYSNIIEELLKDIVKKYEVNIIEDLKAEIKKRETELENISIVELNKLV